MYLLDFRNLCLSIAISPFECIKFDIFFFFKQQMSYLGFLLFPLEWINLSFGILLWGKIDF